jgi:Transposase IS4
MVHCDPLMVLLATQGSYGLNMESPDYNPLYKVAEFMNQLINRFKVLFVPGQALSLDESLVRAFGHIKFKVRLMSKAARYGIKLYVLTDAVLAYILHVVVYTGASTYDSNDTETKKTVQVVKRLVRDYEGSHRTIYIDRFYTSIDLLKALDKMGLYATGTVMWNRIHRSLLIAKKSAEYRAMRRGDIRTHKFLYEMEDGTIAEYGLIIWKDSELVYLLTNCHSTIPIDIARRQTRGPQMVNLTRPSAISSYNQFMGGVDLADKRRAHCSCAIMGQNRWWLKVFFYLVDIATANTLVLFNEAMVASGRPTMNIVEFKHALVHALVGIDRLEAAPVEDVPQDGVQAIHEKVRNKRVCNSCVLCAVRYPGTRIRTRSYCSISHQMISDTKYSNKTLKCGRIVATEDNRIQIIMMKWCWGKGSK